MKIKHGEYLPLRGRLSYTVYKNGVPIERFEDNNLIVNGTWERLAHLIAGDEEWLSIEQLTSGLIINRVAIGTSGDVPIGSNTEITDPFIVGIQEYIFPSIGRIQFNWKLLESEANGMGIREFGLLTVDGTLFARRTRDKPIPKESDISIDGEWRIYLK